MGLNIAFFGSSLVSSYWNGAATYYRGIVKALHAHGHRVTFYEPNAYDRQNHRDIADPEWARVVVYEVDDDSGVMRALEEAQRADLVIKASGVGVFDDLLERAVVDLRSSRNAVVFWDVDAPATLDRVHNDAADPFHECIPRYDLILTYGGGDQVVDAYRKLGARKCVPIYNALDPHEHHRVAPDARYAGLLGFMASRLPDREQRVEEFFLQVAVGMPEHSFVLGGTGWSERALPENVRAVGYVFGRDHNAFNSTPRAVLNVNRESMVRYGFSPPTRIFEAAGAGACIITDRWQGIEMFLEPGSELLVVDDGASLSSALARLDDTTARAIGQAAQRAVLARHTYEHRSALLESTISALTKRTFASAERQLSR
jgi:spore maturation protein CgeB